MTEADAAIVGVILAGGLSRRMEGPEKSLMVMDSKPLITHVATRLKEQIDVALINANGDPERFAFANLPVQADTVPGFAGPLAGVLAGMRWCMKHAPGASHIVTVAADTPLFPDNLVSAFRSAMLAAREPEKTICLAQSGGNRHPVFGLWPISIADDLERFLVEEDQQKVMLFAKRYQLELIDFPFLDGKKGEVDPFFNINTPGDLIEAEQLMRNVQ